jgi:hypothetical protein
VRIVQHRLHTIFQERSATTYDCKLKGSNGTIFTRTNVSSPVTFNFSPTSPEVFCLEDIVEHNPNPVNGGGCAIASNDCISINVLPEVSSFIGFYKECMPFPSAYNLPISFTGIPPFSFDIEEVGIGVIGSYTSASNDFIAPITVNPGGGVYRLVNLFGSSGCAGTNYGEINFDPTCTSGGGGGGGGTGGAGGGGASCVYIRMKDAQTSCPGGTVNINFELIDPLGLAVPSGLYNIEYAQINPSSGAIISGPFIVPHTVPGGTGPTYSFSLTHLGTITNNAYFVITDVTRAGGCPLPVSYGGVIAVTAHTNASGLIRINPEVVCIPGTITCTVFGASSMPSGNYDFKITENPGGALTLFSGLPLPHTFIRTLTAPAGSGSLRLHDLLNLTNGCMSGNLNTVNIIKESPITVTLTAGSQTICIGASTTLLGTISGLYSGQSITIILSDGTTKQITSNGAFSISVSPTATQVYSISGISGNKACTPTITVGSYTVNVVKPNPLSITASPMPICAGSSTTLTAVGFANSYQWFNGSTSLCSPCTNTISVTPAASPTVYNLVGTYTGCTVTSNATLAISTNSPPNPCNITFDKILCTGFMEFSVPAQSGVSYSWSAGPSADFEILYGNGSNKVMVARNPSSNALVGTVSVTITNSCGTSTCSYTFIMDCKCPQTESLPANAMSFNNATYNIGSQAAWNAIIGTNTTFVVNGKLTLNINSSTFGAGNYFHLHSFMFTPTSSFEFIMLPGSEIEFNSIGASTAGSNMVDIAYCNFRGYCELWKGLKFNCEDFSWSGGHLEIRDALYGINVAKPVIHFTSAYSDFIQCRHGINFSSNRDPNIAHQVSILGCNFGNLTGTRLPLMPSTLGLLPGSGPHYPYSGITALAITGQTGSEGSFNKGSSGAWYHLMYSLFRNLEIGIEENVMNSVTYSFFRITENQFKDLYTNSSGSSYNYNDGAAISLKRVSNFILETSILENIPNYAVKARVNYVSMDGNSFTNVNYNYDHSSAVPTVPDDYAAISIKSEKNTTNMAWAGFDIGYSGVPSSGNIFSNVTNLPGYRTVYGLSTALGGNTMLHDVDKYFQFSNNQVSNYQRGLYGRGCAGGIYIEDNALKLTDVISAGTNGERYGFDVRYCSGNSPFASFATIKNNIIQHSTGTSYKSVSSFGTGLVTGIIAGDNLTGATPSTAVNSVMIEGNKIYHLMRGIHIKDYLNAGRITCNYMENCYNGILLEGSSNTSNTFAIPVGTSDKLGNEWVYNNTSISLSDKIKHIGTSTQNTSTSGDWEYTLNPGLNPNYDPTINYPTTSFGASSVSGVTFVNVSATVDHPCIASGSAPSGSAPPQSYKVAGQQNFRDLGRETTDPIIRFSEGSQISASPNPTNGVVNIRYNVKYFNPDLSNISISDVAGKSLANIKSIVSEEGTITLDLTELVSGVYFVRLNNLKDQTEHRIKIIKH